jgi:hypothetical protein
MHTAKQLGRLPLPLEEGWGEGTDRGDLERCTDLNDIYRIQPGCSGRCIPQDNPVGSLSLWERAGVRGVTEVILSVALT